MARVLIIGAGGVGAVVAHKCASVPEVFTEIMLASRTKSKCDKIAAEIGGNRIQTAQVDADNVVCNVADLTSGVYVVRIRALRQAQGAVVSQQKFVKE